MDIRSLKLSDLNPAKYNPRKELKPGDTEFEKLKRSIESFGYVELIVVNEATGFTAMKRTTGWHAAIICAAQARGQTPRGGVPVELALPGPAFAEELRKRGLDLRVNWQ